MLVGGRSLPTRSWSEHPVAASIPAATIAAAARRARALKGVIGLPLPFFMSAGSPVDRIWEAAPPAGAGRRSAARLEVDPDTHSVLARSAERGPGDHCVAGHR